MIQKISENVWKFYFREFGSCVYLINIIEKNILIDTGSKKNKDELFEDMRKLKLRPEDINYVLLTHTHYDHTENLKFFKKAKLYYSRKIPEFSECIPEFPEIKIIRTPGHTKDSVCYLYKNILFSGDTIFDKGYIGRTDFPESSEKDMKKSLEKIKKIKFEILCAGHNV